MKLLTRLAFVSYCISVAGWSFAAASSDITGDWRTIDDETGKPKAIIHIAQQADGSFTGTYVSPISTPKYTVCQHCPAPFTNQPIKGLQLLWQLKAESPTAYHYGNGKILDPAKGKIYACKAILSEDANTLEVRGYMGISLLGRTQVWTREKP